jgi:hypothetical protein
MSSSTVDESLDPHRELSEEIAVTLRNIVHVPRLTRHALPARPGFWQRCKLVTPYWREREIPRVFVDGFATACYWNSWKVYTDAIEAGLTVWAGYALSQAHWYGHAWCMLGERIVETTSPYYAYYGAQLNDEELAILDRHQREHDLLALQKLKVVTFIDGRRQYVDYDPAEYAQTIGRERDPITRAVRPGLGRCEAIQDQMP